MTHELQYHEESMFVTLTYDEEHLPDSYSLDKAAAVRFLKRARKRLGSFRYFLAGEYGEKYGRPHYHAIVFGLGQDSSQEFSEAWGQGRCHFGYVSYDSARYTCDYIQKDNRSTAYQMDYMTAVEKPFSIKSLGIGRQYAEDHAVNLAELLGVPFRGKVVALPRYYRQVVERTLGVDLGERIREKMEVERSKEYEYMLKGPFELDSLRERRDMILAAKLRLGKKGRL